MQPSDEMKRRAAATALVDRHALTAPLPAEGDDAKLSDILDILSRTGTGYVMLTRHKTALSQAATRLQAQAAEIARLKQERDEAIGEASNQAHLRGIAEGQLHASELAGVVDGWKRRTTAAEAKAKELAKENGRLKEALTPSAGTKAAYMGEFYMGVTLSARGQEDYRRVQIPWTSIKEIMKAILARAALQQEGESDE